MKITQKNQGFAFETGYEIVDQRGLAIVGMSLGNSYFKKNTITELIKYCADTFGQVKIMIADKPAEHTYKALGYSQKKAKRKARLNGNTLQNHSKATTKRLDNVNLIEWEKEITPSQHYQKALTRINQLYQDNINFRTCARTTTREVLERRLKQRNLEEAIDEGVNYLLKELAFISASPRMFGVDKIAYIYHQRWSILEKFIAGEFNNIARADLGFVIIY